jgi:hypothetical protein
VAVVAGVAGPFGVLAVQPAGKDRLAGLHGTGAGCVLTEHEHLTGGQQPVGDRRLLPGQAGGQPPHHRAMPHPGRGDLVGREQAFRHVEDGRLGKPGHGGIDELARGLREVERAADPSRRLAQPARARPRRGTPGDHQRVGIRLCHRLPADGEPPLTQIAAAHGRGPDPLRRDLGQRMPDQLALARPGHQHVAHVPADDGAGRPPE